MNVLRHAICMITFVILATSCSKTDDPSPSPDPTPTPSGKVTITSISSDYGKAGAEITITGTNFSASISGNTVTLGGKAATITAATSTQLKITIPSDATHGNIEVKVGAATATSTTFYFEPEIVSLSTTTGKPGDDLIITGKHFGTTITDFEVKFGNIAAEISAATATTLTIKVPTGATTGLISVARKSKPPVNGPSFTVATSPGGGSATGFTIIDGSVTISNLVKSNGSYGQIICMTIDEDRNVMYAGTSTHIIKIDLATSAVSTIIKNSDFITIPFGKPSAMDVDANGKLYLLAEMYGAVPTTGGNVYIIDPAAKSAKLAGNRFVGVSLVGSFAINTPFHVMGNGEIIAFDKSFRELCKFSADMSVRTVIYTLPIVLETFVQFIKVDPNTVRIVFTGISGKYYYDYSTTLGAKTEFKEPATFKMVSQTMAGGIKYGVAGEPIVDPKSPQPKHTYTIGKLNATQTGWDKKGSFIIESVSVLNNLNYYNFIGLNGRNYFYADKNGNMYAQILPDYNGDAGIYKFALK